MKKKATKKRRNLDKNDIEMGLLCKKRFHLGYHSPIEPELSATRRALAEAGHQLIAIAQSVFPKGVKIEAEDAETAAAETQRLIEEGAPVLFGATFLADGIVTESDILVRHKDGAVDLYEVKSGTKVKQRYLVDLALQTHVLEACGHELRAAFLLNLNPGYVHKEGADFPPMQLLRSADVTAKVKKKLPHLRARLDELRDAIDDESVLGLPMGSYCLQPAKCAHFDECRKKAPEHPVFELPEMNRELEMALRREGASDIADIDPKRPGLTFSQRNTVSCVRSGEPITEPFVEEELRQCRFPLHFVATASLLDALPRFDGQRPWRRIPFAWAAHTLYDDGRLETASWAHAERGDPRLDFVMTLGKHVGNGGTLLCWDSDSIEHLRSLLEDLPTAKIAVRAIIGRSQVDMMRLFEAGVFHPDLRGHADLVASTRALLGDASGEKIPVRDDDDLRELLQKAWTPRVRATTREKIAAQIAEAMAWRSEKMLELFSKFSGIEPKKRSTPTQKKRRAPARSLPKLPPS